MTIVELVERERARLRRMHVLVGLALSVGATSLLIAAGASTLGSARWMSLPRPVPFLVWLLVLGANAGVVFWTLRRLERRTARNTVAAAIEREQSMRAGSVRGAMEVANTGALGRLAATAVGARLAPAAHQLAPVEQRTAQRGALRAGGAATLAFVALAVTAPKFNDGLLAILKPVSAWQGTLLPRIGFNNLPPEILRGETLRLQIAAARRGVVTLSQRMPGEAWATQTVPVDPRTGVATVEVGPLRGDLRIVATDGRSASDTATVRVTDRPFVGAVSMRATYPAYLGRPAEAIAVGEPARVPQGTVIEISGRASTALRDVRLGTLGDTFAFRVSDHSFDGRFSARKSGHYAWLAYGTNGPIADVPPPLELEVVPDSAPHVELVSPCDGHHRRRRRQDFIARDSERRSRSVAHRAGHVAPRHNWRRANADHSATRRRLSDRVGWEHGARPRARALKPGDALHVKVVALDNSPWGQRGESRELLLKIPTMEERRAIARASMDSAVSQVNSAAQEEKAIQQRTSDAARDRTQRSTQDAPANAGTGDKKGSMSYDAAEKAKAVAKDQRALTDQVKSLQQGGRRARAADEAGGSARQRDRAPAAGSASVTARRAHARAHGADEEVG
jgi:hypothetical protein